MMMNLIKLVVISSIVYGGFVSANESGDVNENVRTWSDIIESKTLRVLKFEAEEENQLPRSGSSSLYHLELISRFAEIHHLEIQWVKVNSLSEMFNALEHSKADMIARNLTITNQRQQMFSFTKPLRRGKEVLVTSNEQIFQSENNPITVSVPKQTSYVNSIKVNYPHWKLKEIDNSLNAEAVANAIHNSTIQYSILDEQDAKSLLNYRSDIKIAMELKGDRYFAWATAKNNSTLLIKLNDFISHNHAKQSFQNIRRNDLAAIKKQKQSLRVITRNSPETYFLWKGELAGFEYELMREYAKRQGLRLEIIVADSFDHMTTLLSEGKGDLIAAGISRTQKRRNALSEKFSFSSRYSRVSEMLVAHKDSVSIKTKTDLKGRTIGIRKSSAFVDTATTLASQFGAKIEFLDDRLPTELIIEKVANKTLDLTIADSNLVGIEKRFRNEIVSPITFKKSIPYAYITRQSNPQLLTSLNHFIKKIYRGTFYNVVKNKYFGKTKRQTSYREHRVKKGDNLSPYDRLVQQSANQYQFDWKLITAQMFQESRFNPNAKSNAGALGLMQVLPRTANELGIDNLSTPSNAIAAGVKYLDWTRKRFLSSIPVSERIFFSLASYNAGFGHVRDAQRLAKEKGLDPTKWFNNVEKMMLLLQQPEYYKKARFGYCRGSEPVNYVRSIQQRYLTYSKIVQ